MTSYSCNGTLLDLSSPKVMGILNITPDSFYDGGHHASLEDQVRHAENMAAAGASIIDVGAVSTRPGAGLVSEAEELDRLIPVIEEVRKSCSGVIISADTFRARVAAEAVKAGAGMINDVYAGRHDPDMFKTMASLGVPYVMMHMKGEPASMQDAPAYSDILAEIAYFFEHRVDKAREAGIRSIIIDPGFGFGKTVEHNYRLLAGLERLLSSGLPLLVGFSRKSMIYKPLEKKPEDALNGTTVLNTVSLLKGASILRVHDVTEAIEAVRLISLLTRYSD
jgi:dihydropteroate synthase